jgi:O-antigen/teichoic acid export membrane protein
LKLFAFGLTAAGVVSLFAAPLLFDVAFGGKFHQGFHVLPWTITYCIWFALFGVAQNYMWCREKAHLASAALAVGLAVNVGLNLLLLPRMGLKGAVLATAASHLVVLVLICGLNRLLGFRLGRGAWVMLALPIVVCLDPWIALLVLLAVGLDAIESERIFSRDEKQQLRDGLQDYVQKLRNFLPTARSTA